jgi:hypothetical protein
MPVQKLGRYHNDKNGRAPLMRTIARQLRNQSVGFLALFLVLASGGAYAAFDSVGPDADIDACFAKRGGDLRLLQGRSCKRGERPLSWAQAAPEGARGPAGAAGPQGAAGPRGETGPQGERGPSETVATAGFNGRTLEIGIDGINDSETVATMPLTPGAYVLTADADLRRATGSPGPVECTLYAGDASDYAWTALGINGPDVDHASLTMTVVTTLQAPVDANVICTELQNGGALVTEAKIVATRVASAQER